MKICPFCDCTRITVEPAVIYKESEIKGTRYTCVECNYTMFHGEKVDE